MLWPHLGQKAQQWRSPSLLTLGNYTTHRHLFVSHVHFTPCIQYVCVLCTMVQWASHFMTVKSAELRSKTEFNAVTCREATVHEPSLITTPIKVCCHFMSACLSVFMGCQPHFPNTASFYLCSSSCNHWRVKTQWLMWTDVGLKTTCHMCTKRMWKENRCTRASTLTATYLVV